MDVVGEGGEQVEGLVDIAPSGAGADMEARGQACVGVAVAQVGEHEQGLLSWT